MLAWTFRHGWLTISLGLASVAVSLVLATQLKLRMVPFADRDQFAVEIYLRPDTPLELCLHRQIKYRRNLLIII